MKIEIKNRMTKKVIISGEFESIKEAIAAALKQGKSLRGADLSYADLSDANLNNVNLRYANLSYTDLSYADLGRANLSYADLSRADFNHTDLTNAKFSNTKLVGEEINRAPLQLYGLRWPIFITPEYMEIGCERHTHEEWSAFDRVRISEMAEHAWDWWKEHKELLLAACDLHRKQAEALGEIGHAAISAMIDDVPRYDGECSLNPAWVRDKVQQTKRGE